MHKIYITCGLITTRKGKLKIYLKVGIFSNAKI